jgi:hypothetical protein
MDRKEYLKEWRKKNREKIKEYNANYFQENKETIKIKRQEHEKRTGYHNTYSESVFKECVCGKILKVGTFYLHRRNCKEYQSTLTK